MSSIEYLREFVNERLTAAAEEIFGVFRQTIVEYEEELDRQRRLLDVVWNPEIKLQRIELPQRHVFTGERFTDQQLCVQERNFSLDQEDPEPPEIKEDEDEFCTSLETEEQGTDASVVTSNFEGSDDSEDETLKLDKGHIATEMTPATSFSKPVNVVSKPKSDHQLLSHISRIAKRRDQEEGERGHLGPTTHAEPVHMYQHHDSISHSDNENTFTTPELNCNTAESSLVYDASGKDFNCTSKLETHSRIHTGAYPCKICGKDFQCVSDLKAHMTVHIGEKPYTCKTCGRAFRWSCDLTVHNRRAHTGERPYLCKTCGKRFGDSSTLRIHMRIHTDERPYTCQICGKAYRQSGTLKDHMRAHTGEKPHLCSTCGKGFMTMSALRRHSRIHTGEKPYTCNTCGRAFGRSSHLSEHIRRTHVAKKS